jgi:hypothetical protein
LFLDSPAVGNDPVTIPLPRLVLDIGIDPGASVGDRVDQPGGGLIEGIGGEG